MDEMTERLLRLSAAVIELASRLPKKPLLRQIGIEAVRTTTSAGASFRETRDAPTRADFVRRVRAAAKQMAECLYWLQLVDMLQVVPVKPLLQETDEIIGLLLVSARTAR